MSPNYNPLQAALPCAFVLALKVSSSVCAAGFTDANWTTLGSGMNGAVDAIAVSENILYAAGEFTTAGDTPATNIAKWNGSSWIPLGSGLPVSFGEVDALAVSGTNLYAGGVFTFTNAGGNRLNYIAKWDGSNWLPLGSGMNGPVYALAISESNLYAGGQFTTAGGKLVNHVTTWNGSSWTNLSTGMNFQVFALAVSGGNLYAGGNFTNAGGIGANCVAKWDGNSWTNLGSGVADVSGAARVYSLAVSNADLYVGGLFTSAGGAPASAIARWDGNAWSALGSGVYMDPAYSPPLVQSLALGKHLCAGGFFTNAGGTAASCISKWDGTNWTALGSGAGPFLTSTVYALAISGNDLYVGGSFRNAGGKPAGFIARAYLLPLPILSMLGSSSNATVSWPSPDNADFTLEQTDKSVPTAWSPNTASINNDGTNKWVSVPTTNAAQFFRLRRP